MDVTASGSSSVTSKTTGYDAGDDKTEDSTIKGKINDESEESSNAAAAAAAADVSHEETPAEGGGGGEKCTEIEEQETSLTKMEIKEQEDASMKESTESEFSLAAVADQESSESDGGEEEVTENRIFQNLPPNFPSRYTKLISDPEKIRPRILIEKKLQKADVDASQNRLAISAKKIKETFLLKEEEAKLNAGEVMEVKIIEPEGGPVSSLRLRRRWIEDNRQPRSYMLTGAWKHMVARNRNTLTRRKLIRIWYFRVNGELWFAVDVLGSKKDCEIEKQMARKWYHQNAFAP